MTSSDLARDDFEHQEREALKTDMKAADSNNESVEDLKVVLATQRKEVSPKKMRKVSANRPNILPIFTQPEVAIWTPLGASVW